MPRMDRFLRTEPPNKITNPKHHMRNQPIILTSLPVVLALCLCSCETVPDQYGRPHNVLTPAGAAIVNTVVSTGIGTGTGALMNNQPGWITGGASSLAGSIASQLVNAFTPQAGNYSSRPQYCGVPEQDQGYQQNQGYQNNYGYPTQNYRNQNGQSGYSKNHNQAAYNRATQNQAQIVYVRNPDGTFSPAN